MARTLEIILSACLLMVIGTIGVGADEGLPGPVNDDDAVLAVVGNEKITVSQFHREMELRGGNIPGQYATATQRKALLYEMIQKRALAERARREGFDKDPEVVAVYENAMVNKLEHQELDRRLEALQVTNEDVAAYYEEHSKDYARPARFKAAIIFIAVPKTASDDRREALKLRAEQALEEARALGPETIHFGPVARKYSDDRASRYQGGVIGWLVRHALRQYKWDSAVIDAIFTLSEPGEIGPIVTTDKGFFLVRLVNLEEERERPLEQVRDGIRHQLLRNLREQLREAFLDETVAQAEVSVFGDVLDSIEGPNPATPEAGDQTPPALPAG